MVRMGQRINETMKAVVVDSNAPAHLALGDVELPKAGNAEVLVRVKAVSLNRGEVRGAQKES